MDLDFCRELMIDRYCFHLTTTVVAGFDCVESGNFGMNTVGSHGCSVRFRWFGEWRVDLPL